MISQNSFWKLFVFPFISIYYPESYDSDPDLHISSHYESEKFSEYFKTFIKKTPPTPEMQKGTFDFDSYVVEWVQPCPRFFLAVLIGINQKVIGQNSDAYIEKLDRELRTPLTGILHMVSMIGDTHLTTNQRQHINVIVETCTNLFRILSNMIDFHLLQQGRIELQDQTFELSHIVDFSFKVVGTSLLKLQLDYGFSYSSKSIPNIYIADANRIQQTIINVLQFCIKSSHIGGSLNMYIHYNRQDQQLEITFKDHGKGFTEKEQQMLIEENHGEIGILIVQYLTRLMKGSFKIVRSSPGQGTEYLFVCPAKVAPAVEDKKSTSDSLYHRSVLIVDENSNHKKSLFNVVSKWGMKPQLCSNLEEAADVLGLYTFDFILYHFRITPVESKLQDLHVKYPKTKWIAISNNCQSNFFSGIVETPFSEIKLMNVMLDSIDNPTDRVRHVVVVETNVHQMAFWKSYLKNIKGIVTSFHVSVDEFERATRKERIDLLLISPLLENKEEVWKHRFGCKVGQLRREAIYSREQMKIYLDFFGTLPGIVQSTESLESFESANSQSKKSS